MSHKGGAMNRAKIIGYGLALLAVFFWSLNVLIAQAYITHLSPVEFAFGRWVLALLILLPIGGRQAWHSRGYLLHHFGWLVGLAMSGIVLDNTLIYVAARTVDAVNLSLLNLLGPIFLAILSVIFLKDKIGKMQMLGIGVALIGVMTIITRGQPWEIARIPIQRGVFWMILNAFCFACYSLLQYARPKAMSQTGLLCATVLVGVLILAPFFAVMDRQVLGSLTWKDYVIFVYLGVFNSVLAYLAWNSALARLGPTETGIIYYLQPVFSMIGAYIALSSPIYVAQIVGGLLVLSGVVIVGRFQRKERV